MLIAYHFHSLIMGKNCGRGNERLDAKALAVYHVAEGEGGGLENFSKLTGLRISLEMQGIQEDRSLNKEALHVVINHFIMHLTFINYAAHCMA